VVGVKIGKKLGWSTGRKVNAMRYSRNGVTLLRAAYIEFLRSLAAKIEYKKLNKSGHDIIEINVAGSGHVWE
jgi:hypothetical protein